jgi:hypothetical protein
MLFDKRYKKEDVIVYTTHKLLDKTKAESDKSGVNKEIIERYKIMETIPNKEIGKVLLTKKVDDVLYIETDGYNYKYKHIKISHIDNILNSFSAYNKHLPFKIPTEEERNNLLNQASDTAFNDFYSDFLKLANQESGRMTEVYKNALIKAVKKKIERPNEECISYGITIDDMHLLLMNEAKKNIQRATKYIISNRINALRDLLLITKPFIEEFVENLEPFFT